MLTIFFSTVFMAAYLLRLAELPIYRQHGEDFHYFNSIWLTVITLTTVGYGDISTVTVPGRILTMGLALWGTILLSLVVVVLTGIFELDNN